MLDLLAVAMIVAFFAVAAAFVAACDKIIGPDVALEGEELEAPHGEPTGTPSGPVTPEVRAA